MKENKRYIIRKFIMASSPHDALRKEKDVIAADVFLDEKWLEASTGNAPVVPGFKYAGFKKTKKTAPLKKKSSGRKQK